MEQHLYAYPPVSHEPRVETLGRGRTSRGLHLSHMPSGIKPDEKDGQVPPSLPSTRRNRFSSTINARQTPRSSTSLPWPSTKALPCSPPPTRWTGWKPTLPAAASPWSVSTRDRVEATYSAAITVVVCGALSSALLLRSASDAHTDGLADASDLVRRNHMRHSQSVPMTLLREPNHRVF